MGCDYVIEMDCLVIILIQQNYSRSHVHCNWEHSRLRGVFPPASELITALLEWEMALTVPWVRDKHPFSLAWNPFYLLISCWIHTSCWSKSNKNPALSPCLCHSMGDLRSLLIHRDAWLTPWSCLLGNTPAAGCAAIITEAVWLIRHSKHGTGTSGSDLQPTLCCLCCGRDRAGLRLAEQHRCSHGPPLSPG